MESKKDIKINLMQFKSFSQRSIDQIQESDMNEYIVKCDSINSKMEIFFNGESTGIIDYTDIKKITYIESIIWLGCGSMITDDIYKNIGSFEYDLVFALDIQIDFYQIK